MRTDTHDVIIIGAGASGLMCAGAINRFDPSLNVLVIEKNNKPGKKLLATGNGRCNFTNLDIRTAHYHTDDERKLAKILHTYGSDPMISFFEEYLGIISACKGDLVYPITYQSRTVCDALLRACSKTEFLYDTPVVSVVKEGPHYLVNGVYKARNIVFASGGVSFPQSGSDGSLFAVIRDLAGEGSFESPVPSLVPLKSSDKDIKALSGLRQECAVKLDDHVEQGEIQFTDYGVSGICVMQLSGIYNRKIASGIKIDHLSADLIPSMDRKQKIRTISSLISNFKDLPAADALSGLLKKPIAECVVKRSDGSPGDIARVIDDFRITLTGSLGFDNSQVTSGGLRLKAVNDGLEIKRSPGAYVCGEALNVDGLCGGYNLHFAWSSALIAAGAICEDAEVE